MSPGKLFVFAAFIATISAMVTWLNMAALRVFLNHGSRGVVVFLIVMLTATMSFTAAALYYGLSYLYGTQI